MELVQKILNSLGLKPKPEIDIDLSVRVLTSVLIFNLLILITVFKLRKRSIWLAILITSIAFFVNLVVFVYGINYLFY